MTISVEDVKRLLPKMLLLAIVVGFVAHQVHFVMFSGLTKGDVKYVSDECWYVSSARNMLRKYFGLKPNAVIDGKIYVTVLCRSSSILDNVTSFIEVNGGKVLKYYEHELKDGYPYAIGAIIPLNILNNLKSRSDILIIEGYPYPDWDGIIDYMNLEHPPLAKYILCLTLLVSDNPVSWKIPSIIAGALIIVFAYLVASRVFNEWIGVVAALAIAVEPVVRSMSVVAMLDIYLALFSIISLYFAVTGRYYLSAIFIGLAGSVKMSGFFNVLAIMASGWRKLSNVKLLLCVIVIPALVYLTVNIPIIVKEGGLINWINLVLWALSWHTSSRPPGGPPVANPWDWFIGHNAFPLHFSPNLYAMPSPFLMLATLPLTVILVPLALKELIPGVGSILSWYWAPIVMYTLLYFIGNRTQYSFYTIHITPFAVLLVASIVYLALNTRFLVKVLNIYVFEDKYRNSLLFIVAMIVFIVTSYYMPLPGIYRVFISALIACTISTLFIDDRKRRILIAFLTVLASYITIVVIWFIQSPEGVLRLLTRLTPLTALSLIIAPLCGVITSMLLEPLSGKALELLHKLEIKRMESTSSDDEQVVEKDISEELDSEQKLE